MNILVCVKQVPDTTEIRIDPEKNTLIRDGVPSILNPFDGYALEAAARLKDKDPETRIVVVSMGPPQAEKALRACLAAAADRAYLVSGRAFGGSDTLATSYILASAIRTLEEREGPFDAVFCGKQAIDGDTAQVGPEIAEQLGRPQVTCALEAFAEGGGLRVHKEVEEGVEVIDVAAPCLVTFTKPAWNLRYPTIRRKLAADKAEIPVLGEDAFPAIDRTRIGLAGSPTQVKRTFVPPQKTGGVTIREEQAADAAKKLLALLDGRGVLAGGGESHGS